MLRECIRSYNTPTHRNRAAETNPCEIICTRPPSMPYASKMKKPRVTKPMCEMDEYAISFFMSVCTSATRPMYTIAIRDKVIMKPAREWLEYGRMGSEKRTKTY